ncbi:MAG: pyruvate kinase [Bacilli bacterium]|nr:pyruvate kinase [Bacilli bacterium]
MNKTKVIATIGPNTSSKEMIKSFINNGVDCIRINMSHSTSSFCSDVISKINEVNQELRTYVSIMLDLKGPGIRVGEISNDAAFLKNNDKIRIFMDPIIGDNTKFSVDYEDLIKDVSIGNVLKIDDGNVELQVIDIEENYILCKVIKEGIIKSNKSVNVPGVKINRPFLSEEDKRTIKFAHENNVDFLALSFVSSEEDVLQVNDLLINLDNDHIQIVSKIETKEALESIDNIIKMSDGIIIARGDLGCEIAIERVPGIQKKIISKCLEKGKFSIVSTELMSNMATVNHPTRAEISDVANAVLDGADAVMLAGETTISNYPIETLKLLERTIKAAEYDINYDLMMDIAIKSEANDTSGSLCYSVAMCANRLNCKAIFAPTISGNTARKISRFKPLCPILAVSPNKETVKSLTLNFGVYPVLISDLKSFDSIVEVSKKVAIEYLELKPKDNIIITGGYPFKTVKHTNFMKIEEL